MKKRGMHMKKTNMNLIPDCENQTPDYYCTWQTQLYATNDGKPKMQRQILGEKALFAQEKPFGWAYFYPDARRDLYFVMDDSWDVPPDGDESYYGSLVLNKEKFPESVGGKQSNAEALLSLTERIKSLGWKGLGGWVCAQESERFDGKKYWETRFQDANFSGFSYWKVDWGKHADDPDFRKMLTLSLVYRARLRCGQQRRNGGFEKVKNAVNSV